MIILTDIWHQSFQIHLENTLTAVYYIFFSLFKSSNERHYLTKKILQILGEPDSETKYFSSLPNGNTSENISLPPPPFFFC